MAVFAYGLFTGVFMVCLSIIVQISGSANTDSATIRAIESEVRRLKGTSDSIFGEIKKQKDSTAALQNEFKWLHNEIRAVKKSLSDIEQLVNQTVRNDTDFIREKITNLSNFIFKVGTLDGKQKAATTSVSGSSTTTTTALPLTSTTTTKKFKLF